MPLCPCKFTTRDIPGYVTRGFDHLKSQLEEYHEAITIDTMAQQAAQLLPKHRSAKHKEALKRAATTTPADQLTAALQTPRPDAFGAGSKLPHEPRQRPVTKMESQDGRLKDAKQNGGMVARFGSALLSITVAMLAVGLFLSDLPMTTAADPYLHDAAAKAQLYNKVPCQMLGEPFELLRRGLGFFGGKSAH